ncbi:hypothetical protein GT347_01545 [Xylophilus rhododendri]|uniref:Uncharacterized protein n=1 Tax=Xylophilus rhododendri TaxID=2697032 RepID=A0A857J0T1_9BURK|nr:hypothetical protein [Xylophilus rhododendri]QHI96789.1 hypothetical protein GT347_01545 [Xylophilus rhododendri]
MQELSAYAPALPAGQLGIGEELLDVARTGICIWALDTLDPPDLKACATPLDQARRQMDHGSRLIHDFRGSTAGDEQAIEAYQAGVALGFYELQSSRIEGSSIPIAGSVWHSHQLQRLRHIGMRHGARFRGLMGTAAPSEFRP